jgi:polyhydroxyalkanoate synthesis regulator phasin
MLMIYLIYNLINNNMELQILENTQKIIDMINEWEISASQVKLFMNAAEKQFKQLKEFVDEKTKREIDEWKTDRFKLISRSTYDYKEDKERQRIYAELAQRQDKLQIATEMSLKWDSYVDVDWVIIEPVPKKTTESLYLKK